MTTTTTLTRSIAAAALALLAGTAHATHCTNGAKDYPTCTPPSTPSPGTTPLPAGLSSSAPQAGAIAGAQAAAGAQAGAVGVGSGGSATSAGGAATGGSSSLGVNSADTSSSRAWSLFIPPPVFTPPMPRPDVPVQCAAPTEEQGAWSIGAGVIGSKAFSLRDNDPCTAIKFSQLLWDRCQYRKADRALAVGLKLFARKAGEEWSAAADDTLADYTPKDCAVLMAPAPPPVAPVYFMLPPPRPTPDKAAEPSGPKPCPTGWLRNSKGICYDPKWISGGKGALLDDTCSDPRAQAIVKACRAKPRS